VPGPQQPAGTKQAGERAPVVGLAGRLSALLLAAGGATCYWLLAVLLATGRGRGRGRGRGTS
jgi:hypothetical protein